VVFDLGRPRPQLADLGRRAERRRQLADLMLGLGRCAASSRPRA
jgi:hypothetical protein